MKKRSIFYKYRIFILIFIVISIIILISFYNILTPEKKLPIFQPAEVNYKLVDSSFQHIKRFHKIGDFKLVNQNGKLISQESYNGKIYIADFFFTTCPSICPVMTGNMLKIQNKIINDPSIMLISYSVDPENDSVDKLKEYAIEKGIIDSKWNLVTGDKKEIYDLARKSYFVAEINENEGLNEIIHTENFVLIDPDKRIRGYYDGTNYQEINKLLEDIVILKKEYKMNN
ncbi:MAG: SCO family protein [Flavobacteriaceae bacterium]|nr:SCO family protein [Flavobacteriaceae bacterium]